MILYKYLSLSAARKMLATATLGFSQSWTFNDPTETTASSYRGEPALPMPDFFSRPQMINGNYGICCLTRTPLNAIMWAHYAESHSGLVVGIDTAEAGIESVEQFILPARLGSVIYTSSKPTHQYQASEDQSIYRATLNGYDPAHLEGLQRTFLHKSAQWAYEEEVRIVKTLRSFPANTQMLPHPRYQPYGTYLYPIPRSAITSIHFGWRSLPIGHLEAIDLFKEVSTHAPGAKLHSVSFKKESWDMLDSPIPDWDSYLDDIYQPHRLY